MRNKFLVAEAVFLFLSCIGLAFAATTKVQDIMNLDFGTFKMIVEKSGKIRSITAGDELIIKELQVFTSGRYKDKQDDTRVFQGNEFEQYPGGNAAVTIGIDNVTIDRHGILGNAQYNEMFDYAEKITIDATGLIKVNYAIKMLKELVWDWSDLPGILFFIPASEVVDRGMKFTDVKTNAVLLKVLTPEYNKENFDGATMRKLEVNMTGGLLSIEGKEGTTIRVGDARAWGGAELQCVTRRDDIPLKEEFSEPAGTIKNCNLEIKLPVKKGVIPAYTIKKKAQSDRRD